MPPQNQLNIHYLTANCGNAGLGTSAVKTITKILTSSSAPDAFVLNLQEVNRNSLEVELRELKDLGYTFTKIHHKNITTKWYEAFTSSSIATYVVHKNDIKIEDIKRLETQGENSNKGGILSRFTLKKTISETEYSTTIDSISAHYSSSNPIKRAQDHINTYKKQQEMIGKKPFETIDDLASNLPTLSFVGADMNVRNISQPQPSSSPTELWAQNNTLEITPLQKLPLISVMNSAINTYGEDSSKGKDKDKDKKDLLGKGYLKQGSLDWVGSEGALSNSGSIEEVSVEEVEVEKGEEDSPNKWTLWNNKRDHKVLIRSTTHDFDPPQSNFEKVKQHTYRKLLKLRHELAESLLKLEEANKEDEAHLLNIYNLYLGLPDGLVYIQQEKSQQYLKEVECAVKKDTKPDKKKLEKISEELWAEPTSKDYEEMCGFSTLKTEAEKVTYLKEFETTQSSIDTISHNTMTHQTVTKMKAKIGEYEDLQLGKSPDDIAGLSEDEVKSREDKTKELEEKIKDSFPGSKSKEKLYTGIDAYKLSYQEAIKKHNEQYSFKVTATPPQLKSHTFFRERLHDYINEQQLKHAKAEPDRKAITIKELLGAEGEKLYQLALEEEANSTEYRDAVYLNSASLIDGPAWKKPPFHIIAGPSASGKTYAAQKLFSDIRDLFGYKKNTDDEKNLMIQPDGGTVREVSQMRKLMVDIATSQGYSGFSDLHKGKNKKPIEEIKDYVLEAAITSKEKVGITVPDTYAKWSRLLSLTSKKNIKENQALLKTVSTTHLITTSEIVAPQTNNHFKKTVEKMGTGRAYKSSGFYMAFKQNQYDLNSTNKVESKKYDGTGFIYGISGSKNAISWMKKNIGPMSHFQSTNDLQVREDDNLNTFLVSQKVINAWEHKPEHTTINEQDKEKINSLLKAKINTKVAREALKQAKENNLKIPEENATLEAYITEEKKFELEVEKALENTTTIELAAIYRKLNTSEKEKLTLKDFNQFLGTINKSPKSTIKGSKKLTRLLVQEQVKQLNDEKKIKALFLALPPNYTKAHLKNLKKGIDALSATDAKKIAYTYHKDLESAYNNSHPQSVYDELHEYLVALLPDKTNKKVNYLIEELNSAPFIENKEFRKKLIQVIKQKTELFFKLGTTEQIEIYQKLKRDTQNVKATKAIEAIEEKALKEEISIELLTEMVLEDPRILEKIKTYETQAVIYESILNMPLNDDRKTKIENAISLMSNKSTMRSLTQITQTNKTLKAEAIYQQYLAAKAFAQGMSNITNIPKQTNHFTLQGHLLVDVTLQLEDYQTIYKNITGKVLTTNLQDAKASLEKVIGSKLTQTTHCSVDVIGHEALKADFKKSFDAGKGSNLEHALNLLMDSDSRASVITLEEEVLANFDLFAKVSKDVIFPLKQDGKRDESNEAQWEEFTDHAREALLKTVKLKTKECIEASLTKKNQSLNFKKLNKSLDKARKKLLSPPEESTSLYQEARNQFVKSLLEKQTTPTSKDTDALLDKLYAETLKKDGAFSSDNYSATMVTTHDAFRTDNRNQVATRLTGTKYTSHNKKIGKEHQASRIINRSHYQLDSSTGPKVTPLKIKNIEIRVPSLAVLKDSEGHFISKNSVINDVADKLEDNYNKLSEGLGGYKGPMTYNLLTSIDPIADRLARAEKNITHFFTGKFNKISFSEYGENYQSRSAELILKGAHEYNKKQIGNSPPTNKLFFVQNIPVNGHGNPLKLTSLWGMRTVSQPLKEASLMTELSLLETLSTHQHQLDAPLKTALLATQEEVRTQYTAYLNKKMEKPFSDSPEGKKAIEKLNAYKKEVGKQEVTVKKDKSKTLESLAANALALMHANNDHQNLKNGMTIQSLSIFLQKASISGCKSANERYAAVSGRVELLQSMDNRESLSDEEIELKMQLEKYINDDSKRKPSFLKNNFPYLFSFFSSSPAKQVQDSLDKTFNEHNTQGAITKSTKDDLGAESKLKSMEEMSLNINTNSGESINVTYLSNENSGKGQSHKMKQGKMLKKACVKNNAIQGGITSIDKQNKKPGLIERIKNRLGFSKGSAPGSQSLLTSAANDSTNAEKVKKQTYDHILKLFNKQNISNEDSLDVLQSFEQTQVESIELELAKFPAPDSTSYLSAEKASKYQKELETFQAFIEEQKQKISLKISLFPIESDINKNLFSDPQKQVIESSRAQLIEEKKILTTLAENIKSKIEHFTRQANVAYYSDNLTRTTTTLANLQSLLKRGGPISSTDGALKTKSTIKKELAPIAKDQVALYQLTHTEKSNDENIAFTESCDHKEIKAVPFEEDTSPAAKMKLALVMAQHFLMNLADKPSEDNKIYLRGKDPDFVKMLHGALKILSVDQGAGFDMGAIDVLVSTNHTMDDGTEMAEKITTTIGQRDVDLMLKLSHGVQEEKQTVNNSSEVQFKAIKEKLEEFKTSSTQAKPQNTLT